jgi:hypothetical protein
MLMYHKSFCGLRSIRLKNITKNSLCVCNLFKLNNHLILSIFNRMFVSCQKNVVVECP